MKNRSHFAITIGLIQTLYTGVNKCLSNGAMLENLGVAVNS